MAALTSDRRTSERNGVDFYFPVAAGTVIYSGSIVAMSGGFAVPASAATGLVIVGRADEQVNNTGADGDMWVRVRKGCFAFDASTSNPPALTNVGEPIYAEDDQTLTTSATGTSEAGKLVDVNDDGAWVQIS
jgi:hypothetical protein